MIAGSLENIYILTLKKRQWLFWLDFRANLTRLVGRDHREHVWFRMQWRVDKKGHSPQATRWATGYWAKTRTSKTEGLVAIKLFKTIAAILRILRNHSCNCSLPAQMSPSGWLGTLAYGLMWNVDTAGKKKDLENRVRAGLWTIPMVCAWKIFWLANLPS